MSVLLDSAGGEPDDVVRLADFLLEISRESIRLAEQCGTIQWSISAMLEIVDHPDLGAEIHMLQDIDRIQQTLSDIAAILAVTGAHADSGPILKTEIGSAVRLDSLRQRLGLSEDLASGGYASGEPDITWF